MQCLVGLLMQVDVLLNRHFGIHQGKAPRRAQLREQVPFDNYPYRHQDNGSDSISQDEPVTTLGIPIVRIDKGGLQVSKKLWRTSPPCYRSVYHTSHGHVGLDS
jgi:hypothetical protein